MKRLVTFISTVLLCAALGFAGSGKTVKAPGLSLSSFGIEPGFLFGFDHTELLLSCAVVSDEGLVFTKDYDSDYQIIAITPKLHLGYNIDGFETGWNNSIGVAYASSIAFENNGIGNMEALAMYYRGEAIIRAGLGIGFTAYLPMLYFVIEPDHFTFKTIGSSNGFWECIASGIVTSSLNFRWYLK